MRILFYIYLAFISTSLSALESTDRLPTQILKVYNKNILVLNRGLEDGIYVGDHIKLTSSEGFIARGLCIKNSILASHWKIYRVVHPELISKDSLYTMTSINQSKMPKFLLESKNIDFSKFTEVGSEPTKEVTLQQERVIKFDLPENTKQADKFKITRSTPRSEIKRIKEEMNRKVVIPTKHHIDFFASPIAWQTRFDQREVHFGTSVYNSYSPNLYRFNFIQKQTRMVDPVTQETYSSQSSHFDANYQWNRLNPSFSLYSFGSYDQEKIGPTYYPLANYQIGVLGLKWHFIKQNTDQEFFDFSYAPVFDQGSYTDPLEEENTLVRNGYRHEFKIAFRANLSKTLYNETQYIYAPYSSFDATQIPIKDTQQRFQTKFSFALGLNAYWEYIIQYENDPLREYLYEVPSQNTTQSIRLRYNLEL